MSRVSEPIIEEATINFAKLITTIKAMPAFYRILTFYIDTNMGYFFFSFLSSLFLFFAFFSLFKDTAKKTNFCKWRDHVNIVQNSLPTYNFKKYCSKNNPKVTILEILVYKIQPEITDIINSGSILYIKISRIVVFGLVFKLYINIVLQALPNKMFSSNFSQILLKKNH